MLVPRKDGVHNKVVRAIYATKDKVQEAPKPIVVQPRHMLQAAIIRAQRSK